jgi:hypothetical protein
MPPFITHNGQTGYFQNGVFVPATQEQYNNQMSMYNQFGNNPFVSAQQTFTQQPQSVQQGVIKPPTAGPLSNEQKVSIAQGDATSTNQYNPQDKLNYEFTDKGLGFKAGNQFYPSTAMTTGGMPLIGSPYKGRTLNAYDLAKEDSSKYGNPYLAIQNQLMNNTPPWMSNTTTPNQAQVTVPQTTGATEIVPTSTAEQAGGGNWLTNMFNRPSVEGVPAANEITNVVEKGPSLFKQSKDFFGSEKGQATSAIAGAGVGLVSGLAKAGMQDKYDPRVGMSKPNLGGNLLGDSTFTQIGLNPLLMGATGGISALVGGGVDLIKNAVKYSKQKDRYENKKLATDTMQSIDDARENMKPDYTGYARSGTQVNPYLKKFNPGGETPTYNWGTSNVNSPNPASIVSTVSSSNTQTNPSITPTTSIPLKNIPLTNAITKEKKSLPFIGEHTGLNNSKNDKLYGLDENIYNNNIFFNDVPVDNTYTGINPNMRKVSNAPYVDMSKEGDLNNASRDYLEAIYTSPGYKRKVENELEKSGIVDKTADDIISERLYRVKNTQMKNMSESDRNYKTAYGYMHPMIYGPLITNPGIRMRTDRVNTEPYNYFSTGIEELEHASHVKRNMFYNMFNSESSLNITPEAKRIFDLHAPASSKESTRYDEDDSYLKKLLTKPYLKQYTENMAKKRASEVYLINKGLLNPGENVNENHYKYLLENYNYLPSNVRSAIDMTNENQNASQLLYGIDKDFLDLEQDYDDDMKWIKKNKKNPNKDDFKLYYDTQERKESIQNLLKKFKKSQENFLKIMNDIGMNLNNPYIQTARFGTYIIPENKSDSANDTTNTLDKRVKCSCGWSWNISEGGIDPYKCHKCGNNNK